MSSQIPNDITGQTIKNGDWLIYTLNDGGSLNFGYVTEMKVNQRKYYGDTIRIKITHTDINGVVRKEKVWNNDGPTDIDKDVATWLNYTGPSRFLIDSPR